MQALIAELSSLTWNDAYNALCVVAFGLTLAWVLAMTIVVIHVNRPQRRRRDAGQKEI